MFLIKIFTTHVSLFFGLDIILSIFTNTNDSNSIILELFYFLSIIEKKGMFENEKNTIIKIIAIFSCFYNSCHICIFLLQF